ncbi:hypothetical protein AAFF_G00004330 [Aldrovandia affinis]|uniref:Uncharacterized protein n=1 Tax=Aldrovandia affinis TaxID=143900 RepID=A0AAD7X518_9TELE|nr:hypothetical protein AAFF_G00004330 [Aldrovandia affinis]
MCVAEGNAVTRLQKGLHLGCVHGGTGSRWPVMGYRLVGLGVGRVHQLICSSAPRSKAGDIEATRALSDRGVEKLLSLAMEKGRNARYLQVPTESTESAHSEYVARQDR